MAKASRNDNLLTRQQMAAMLGVNAQQFDRRYRPHIPKKLIAASGTGRRTQFRPEAVRAIVDALLQAEREKAQMANDEAMLLEDGNTNSPAIERYRLAKAKLAELDLAEKQGNLIRPHLATTALTIVASKLRRLGERLARKHGNQVGDAIDRTLTECQTEMERTFDSTGHRESGSDPASGDKG